MLAVAAVVGTAPAWGTTSTWIGPTGGSWSNANNWSPSGVPGTLVNVLFQPVPAGTYVFDYNYTDSTPIGTLTFGQSTGSISAPTMTQGTSTYMSAIEELLENGTYNQSGGENDVNTMLVGRATTDTANYIFAGGGIAGSYFEIAAGGRGTMTQSGSSFLEAVSLLSVGSGTGSNGTYTLGGGTIDSLLAIDVGSNGGVGTFIQNGASTVSIGSSAFNIGIGAGAAGTANLSAGTITSGSLSVITVGSLGGNGVLLQSGTSDINVLNGTLAIGVGTNSTGIASLSSGTCIVANLTVGGTGTFAGFGTLDQSGSSYLQVGGFEGNGNVYIGQGSGGAGTAVFSGGTIYAANAAVFVGAGTNCSGYMKQTGTSSITAMEVLIADGFGGNGCTGTADLSGGTLLVPGDAITVGVNLGSGTYLQSGTSDVNLGGMMIGDGSGSTGVALLSGGTFIAQTIMLGDGGQGTLVQSGTSVANLGAIVAGSSPTGNGTLILSGGTMTCSAGINVLPGSYLFQSGTSNLTMSGGSLLIQGAASFSGGTLNLLEVAPIVGASGSFGSLVQSGTSVINVGTDGFEIGVGTSSSGIATLSGGTMLFNNGGQILVGYQGGSGTLAQSGTSYVNVDNGLGLVTVGGSAGSAGTALLSGGTLAAGTLIVGSLSAANGVLAQSGLSAITLNNALILGDGSGARGTATLSGGTLNTPQMIIGLSSGFGTLVLNGTSDLNVSQSLLIGDGTGSIGNATFTSGSFTVGTVTLGSPGSPGSLSQNGSLSVSHFSFAQVNPQGSLLVSAGTMDVQKFASSGDLSLTGGTLAITGGGSLGTGSVNSINISTPGVLDVGSSGMVIEYGDGSSPVGDLPFGRTAHSYPTNSIQRYAQTGINGLNWNGPGIISSYAENDPNGLTAVGIVDENDLGIYPNDYTLAGGGNGTWMGQPINDTNNVLVRMTYYGDGNDDGVVNKFDVTALSQGYSGLAGYVGWSDGDYNYDGQINKNDVSLLAASYVFQGAPLGDAITPGQAQYLLALDPDMPAKTDAVFQAIAAGQTPEPATLSLFAASLGLLARRRRVRTIAAWCGSSPTS
jgi:hypothetical protein